MSEAPPPGWTPPPPPGHAAPGPGQSGPAGHGPGHGPGYGPDYGPGYRSGYGAPAWAPPVHKPGVVALRPLGLGDIFDGAFKTIRANPRATIGLAMLVMTGFMVVPSLLVAALALAGELGLDLGSGDPFLVLDTNAFGLVSNASTLFAFLASVVLTGMLVHVVSEAVLGRRTSMGQTWRRVRGRLWRLLGLILLNLLFLGVAIAVPVGLVLAAGAGAGTPAAVLTAVIVGLPALLLIGYVEVRWFLLAAPALVLERCGVGQSLRRAGTLSRQQLWRLLGIWLLANIVAAVAGQVIAIPLALLGAGSLFLMPDGAGLATFLLVSNLSQVLVGGLTYPFTSSAVALQYVDQRIRKEGLDVQLIAAAQQSQQPAADTR